MRLKAEKTRIISRGGQQRVAGVVVNQLGLPPRTLRRQIRAAFKNAERAGAVSDGDRQKLRGYVNYLAQFPSLRESKHLSDYRKLLAALKIA
jgi:hypothetical protein